MTPVEADCLFALVNAMNDWLYANDTNPDVRSFEWYQVCDAYCDLLKLLEKVMRS